MNDIREILKTMEYGPAPESGAIVEDWLEARKGRFGHFIDNEFIWPKGSQSLIVNDPSTGKKLASLAKGSKAVVDDAVSAARNALPAWSALPGQERGRVLYQLARLVQKHARFLAVLETMNNGKPIRESRDIDIPLVARHLYYHAGWAGLVEDEFPGYRPVGACGQIIPWNFPLLMLAWKVAPALATGCTIVLKPAEYTPLTAMAFAELAREAGLPAGVLNIVNGDGTTGSAIVDHDGLDKIAFTGSTEVGRGIRKKTAGSGKNLSLELGGKSPFIVFDDADLDGAVEGIVDAIWFNQGEVCCAGSRLLVQEAVADRFYAKLRKRMDNLRLGSPLDKAIDIGAIVDPIQIKRIEKLVRDGLKEGGTCWQAKASVPKRGSFYPPTLITEVDPASSLAQQEIFGPVLVATTFRTPGEAVELANNTRYGLAASIWSQTLDVALDAARNVKAGIVWVNSTNLFDAAAGFGGYRESGFGREGGREGLYEYLKRPAAEKRGHDKPNLPLAAPAPTRRAGALSTSIDRTAKFYIGGNQVRPDSGYSMPVLDNRGRLISEIGQGNRKDIRNAVEAAHKAAAWANMTGHQRAQILFFIAENLDSRADEFCARIKQMTGVSAKKAEKEVETSITRIFDYAGWADKFDGAVRAPQGHMLSLAMNEPWGVMALSCPDDAPLLGFVSLVVPAIAMGNCVVVTPSAVHPLAATDFYQVLDTSDVPGGVVNIVCGDQDKLADTMAKHDDIAAMWYVGSEEGSALVERGSAGNLKASWVNYGKHRDWYDTSRLPLRDYLRHSCQIKTIWVPYGA